jgi:hypothetical protein
MSGIVNVCRIGVKLNTLVQPLEKSLHAPVVAAIQSYHVVQVVLHWLQSLESSIHWVQIHKAAVVPRRMRCDTRPVGFIVDNILHGL